jgi:hypothetical protein
MAGRYDAVGAMRIDYDYGLRRVSRAVAAADGGHQTDSLGRRLQRCL